MALFNATFLISENTELVMGGSEPWYQPASNRYPHHRIFFAHGFFRSALHEVAHWCVAGRVRRQLADYGYWYQPDGRNQVAQERFEQVEVRPQAFEWLLSLSAGQEFEVSLDNLLGDFEPDRYQFTERVIGETRKVLTQGLPPRLQLLCDKLQAHYQQPLLTDQVLVQAGALLLERIGSSATERVA